MIALSAGVVAGLLAWLIAELTHGFFRPKLYQISAMGLTALQPSQESQRVADNMNAMLAFAILGGVTGLFMGLAGGLAGRSPARGVVAGLGGNSLRSRCRRPGFDGFSPFFLP